MGARSRLAGAGLIGGATRHLVRQGAGLVAAGGVDWPRVRRGVRPPTTWRCAPPLSSQIVSVPVRDGTPAQTSLTPSLDHQIGVPAAGSPPAALCLITRQASAIGVILCIRTGRNR